MKTSTESPKIVREGAELFGQPLDYPYLIGAYLAVNAVSDLLLLVDGPDCAVLKAQHIHGKHDWNSTLLDCMGRHRIAYTATDPRNVALSREGLLKERLLSLARRPGTGAVLVTGLPMCSLTGTQYDRLAREAAPAAVKPLIPLPARSLEGGWLEGYAQTLNALAQAVVLSRGSPGTDSVAIVGYFMDRNEEDHRANLRELRRLLEALELDLVSVWLSGQDFAQLSDIGKAATILAFPYGLEAARTIARRTGARVVETGLPLGLEGTRRWLVTVAEACSRQTQGLVEAELGRVIPRLEWVVGHSFLNRRAMLVADAHLLDPLAAFLRELGVRIVSAVSVGHRGQAPHDLPLLVRPTSGRLDREWERVRKEGVDLVVANSDFAARAAQEAAVVEFGFPSHRWHAFAPSPFLGYEGALFLIQRMANALAQASNRDREDSP